MKDLAVFRDNRRIKSISDIQEFESEQGILLPEYLKSFLLKYEGCKLIDEQSYYLGGNDTYYEINQVLYLQSSLNGGASIEGILKGHKQYGIEGFIPFAIDSGGWDFNVSINQNTYGQVWVNKFDSGEAETIEFVSLSFEEFINGLTSDE